MSKRPNFLGGNFAAATPTSVPDKLEPMVPGQLPRVFEKESKKVGWFQSRVDASMQCLEDIANSFQLRI